MIAVRDSAHRGPLRHWFGCMGPLASIQRTFHAMKAKGRAQDRANAYFARMERIARAMS